MLQHFNSESNNHIRRSKSATSVKERRKHPIISAPLDPESARVHALIAAHRAMDRSRGYPPGSLNRSDSSTNGQSVGHSHNCSAESCSAAVQVRHRRSVLQAAIPGVADCSPYPRVQSATREGRPTFSHPTSSEFGGSFEGEKSSYKRIRRAQSSLHPSRG